ncbi:MAG: cation transporter [Gammaproteobacteria bacterium]|nr:cation transporter [Gammaproteobacteria bacterium]
MDGVVAVDINYSTHRARVRWDPQRIELSRILAAIREIGYHAYPYDSEEEERQLQKEHRQQLRRLGIAGLFGMRIMMIAVAFYTDMQAVMDSSLRVFPEMDITVSRTAGNGILGAAVPARCLAGYP